jgi:hypothetical protein
MVLLLDFARVLSFDTWHDTWANGRMGMNKARQRRF